MKYPLLSINLKASIRTLAGLCLFISLLLLSSCAKNDKNMWVGGGKSNTIMSDDIITPERLETRQIQPQAIEMGHDEMIVPTGAMGMMAGPPPPEYEDLLTDPNQKESKSYQTICKDTDGNIVSKKLETLFPEVALLDSTNLNEDASFEWIALPALPDESDTDKTTTYTYAQRSSAHMAMYYVAHILTEYIEPISPLTATNLKAMAQTLSPENIQETDQLLQMGQNISDPSHTDSSHTDSSHTVSSDQGTEAANQNIVTPDIMIMTQVVPGTSSTQGETISSTENATLPAEEAPVCKKIQFASFMTESEVIPNSSNYITSFMNPDYLKTDQSLLTTQELAFELLYQILLNQSYIAKSYSPSNIRQLTHNLFNQKFYDNIKKKYSNLDDQKLALHEVYYGLGADFIFENAVITYSQNLAPQDKTELFNGLLDPFKDYYQTLSEAREFFFAHGITHNIDHPIFQKIIKTELPVKHYELIKATANINLIYLQYLLENNYENDPIALVEDTDYSDKNSCESISIKLDELYTELYSLSASNKSLDPQIIETTRETRVAFQYCDGLADEDYEFKMLRYPNDPSSNKSRTDVLKNDLSTEGSFKYMDNLDKTFMISPAETVDPYEIFRRNDYFTSHCPSHDYCNPIQE